MLSIEDFYQTIRLTKSCPIYRCSSNLDVKISNRVKDIPENAWNALVGKNQHFLKTPFLKAVERAAPENMELFYLAAYQKGNLVWVAHFQLQMFTPQSLAIPEIQSVENNILKKFKNNLSDYFLDTIKSKNIKLLLCGQSLVSGAYGFSYAESFGEKAALTLLNKMLKEVAKKEKAQAILVKDIPSPSDTTEISLDSYAYSDFQVDPNMVLFMRPDWKVFEDYTAAMSTKYRNRVRSAYQKGESIERLNLDLDAIETHKNSLYKLYLDVHQRADFAFGAVPENYFYQLKKHLPEHFFVKGYFLNGNLVGFSSWFVFEKDMEAHFVGFTPEMNPVHCLYQNMLYDYVKEAFNAKVSTLSYGRTALEIKSTVGAEAVELTSYVRMRSRITHTFLAFMFDYIRPTSWVPRSPFKEVKDEKPKKELLEQSQSY